MTMKVLKRARSSTKASNSLTTRGEELTVLELLPRKEETLITEDQVEDEVNL